MAWPDRGYTDSYIDWGSPREWQFHMRDPCYDDDDEPRFRLDQYMWENEEDSDNSASCSYYGYQNRCNIHFVGDSDSEDTDSDDSDFAMNETTGKDYFLHFEKQNNDSSSSDFEYSD